ncbi:hypothetical protein [Enterobacter sp.]|uniref:hypothetical protein n=1 Tax=Enterobacter sp. TaxID=42895 RepID=UPI00296E3100|nr:hypothetical protein [Enterobacter sp.]
MVSTAAPAASILAIEQEIHNQACTNCFAGNARTASFEDVVKPVIKWLNENSNPHASVIIDSTSAELVTGEIGIHTEEFLKD